MKPLHTVNATNHEVSQARGFVASKMTITARMAGSTFPTMQSVFGAVRQLGYLVSDLEAAMSRWHRVMGAGPFFTLTEYEVVNCEFRGMRTTPKLNVGITYSGSLQIELMQPLGDGRSLYHELLRAGRPGPHYVTFWVDDLATALTAARERDCEVVQCGGVAGAGRFAYLASAGGGPLFELLETNDMIRGWFGSMQAAAAVWDGERLIRPAFG